MRKVLFSVVAFFIMLSCAAGAMAQEDPWEKVKVRFTPRTLNLGSEGNWVTCMIKGLPEGYIPADIDLDTVCIVEVNNMVLDDDGGPICFDKDSGAPYNVGKRKLMVSFDRQALSDVITAYPKRNPTKAKIIIEGYGQDGELQFWGKNRIRVKPVKVKN